MLESLIIPIAIVIIAWIVLDWLSPHPLLTLIVKVILFLWILFKLFALLGIHI